MPPRHTQKSVSLNDLRGCVRGVFTVIPPGFQKPRLSGKMLSWTRQVALRMIPAWEVGLNNRPSFLPCRRLSVRDPGASRLRVWGEPPSWFTDGICSLCPRLEEGAGAPWEGSPLKRDGSCAGGSTLKSSPPPTGLTA